MNKKGVVKVPLCSYCKGLLEDYNDEQVIMNEEGEIEVYCDANCYNANVKRQELERL